MGALRTLRKPPQEEDRDAGEHDMVDRALGDRDPVSGGAGSEVRALPEQQHDADHQYGCEQGHEDA